MVRTWVQFAEKDTCAEVHEWIRRIGGTLKDGSHWSRSAAAVIADIRSGARVYFVYLRPVIVDLTIGHHDGRAYLKTTADEHLPEALLLLPDFYSIRRPRLA